MNYYLQDVQGSSREVFIEIVFTLARHKGTSKAVVQ